MMDANLYGNSGAKAAIEMAAHDALGKSLGKPVYELLGGKRRGRIPALRMIASGDAAADVAEAVRCKREGYVAYKIKVGAGNVQADIERTRAVCAALGAGVLISADANQNWDVAQALEYRTRRCRYDARFSRTAGRGGKSFRHGEDRRRYSHRNRLRRRRARSRRHSQSSCCSRGNRRELESDQDGRLAADV